MKTTLSLLVALVISFGYAADKEIILSGKVLDKKTHTSIAANIEIFCNNDFLMIFSGDTKEGQFTTALPSFGWYIIMVSSPGYLQGSDTLWVLSESRERIEKDIYLSPIEVGQTVTIRNIYFDFGKASLRPESSVALDNVVAFFIDNPTVSFEIGGHTDSQGSDASNVILSRSRAQSVVDYLVSKGVNKVQLKAVGYGESKPLDKSLTPAAEAKNRRVEFKVVRIQ